MGAWLAVAPKEPALVKVNATLGVAAVVLVAAGLAFRFAPLIPVAVVALASGYTFLLVREVDAIDTRGPVVAAALFAITELAYWSSELRGRVADEPGTYLRRAALLALLLVVTIPAGTILLALVQMVGADGIAVELIGGAAALGALALVVLAARREPA